MGAKGFGFLFIGYRHNGRIVFPTLHTIGHVFDFLLHGWIVKGKAHETLDIKYGVFWVLIILILGRFAHQFFFIIESHPRRSRMIALVVRNDLHAIVLPNTHTGIRRSQINPNRLAF